MNEFDVIEHIRARSKTGDPRIAIGPGDDMALLRSPSRSILAAVDQLIAGRHYRADVTPLELVGRKAVTRSLSDIAAMAARPLASLAAGVVPADWDFARTAALCDAMRQTAAHFDCPLVGGDLAVHASAEHPLTLAVTVLAVPGSHPPVSRSGAVAGDSVYATGQLGGSIHRDGLGHHLTFEPRIELALKLSEALGSRLHAMIDISDGLGRDSGHIARLSNVRIILDAIRIPCRAGVSWEDAVSGGEDYELCFCAEGPVPEQLVGVPIHAVGRVEAARADEPRVVFCDGPLRIPGEQMGWEHAT